MTSRIFVISKNLNQTHKVNGLVKIEKKNSFVAIFFIGLDQSNATSNTFYMKSCYFDVHTFRY